MNVAIIPARGGSKRIPRKNIRLFAGKPIIAHSVELALRSGLFSSVVVSTDDEAIAAVARRHGAETPFIRPAELSDDFAGTHVVVAHAVRWLVDHGTPVEFACCLYPTAPLIQVSDLRRGLDLMKSGNWDSVIAATSFGYPIMRALKKSERGALQMFYPEHYKTRSQDLPEAYHDAGQFYWADARTWLAPPQGFTERTTAVFLPRWRVQDIDTVEDWERAEQVYSLIFPSRR
jgi:pseudaminic acid cytidylyltransferase